MPRRRHPQSRGRPAVQPNFHPLEHSARIGVDGPTPMKREGKVMENAGIGWIAAIIIGGIAGWLAEQFMKSNMGVLMNIILGIVGAIVANAILSVFGVVLGGWIGYLIAGFIGACILIAVARMIRR
jgi:uncharacterized membrane protein YeaQ/YmgE (transglycosylase-associated protein family)